MTVRALDSRPLSQDTPFDADLVLGSVPNPIIVIDRDRAIRFANIAAENFFSASAAALGKESIEALVPFGSPLLELIDQVRRSGQSVSEYGIELSHMRGGSDFIDIRVAPVAEGEGLIIISLQERGNAQRIGDQMMHRGAARSVSSMAAVLAHEIKNPLSGVRGAAQLIEQNANPEDRRLTRLICQETDRICALVDQMEIFSDPRPLEKKPVNIHEVLDHVRRLAQSGFARDITFHEYYDPSIPKVPGARDQLVQVLLNLVKNAAEAVPAERGEIILTTAFRHGVRVEIPGTGERMSLPIEVCVIDNGPGVPEDLQPHLFEAFVSSKPGGTGLGLALVAKLIGDHGGMVECDSQAKQTTFRLLLPALDERGEGA